MHAAADHAYLMQFVVALGDKVAPTDIEEGMRVGYASTWPLSSASLVTCHSFCPSSQIVFYCLSPLSSFTAVL